MWILCVCSNLVKYVVVVVVEEFMINWCCCCYEMCVVVNSCYGYSWLWNLWWNLSCFENFMKNGWIGNLWWNDVFESSFIWIWVSFYVYKRLDKLSGWIWALGNQKLGFLGENGVFHESRIFENCQNSPPTRNGELWQFSKILLSWKPPFSPKNPNFWLPNAQIHLESLSKRL